MGTLSRGSFTYGNKTNAQIILITGANEGDTVWDTTYNKRRMWDGDNFIHCNQKSLGTTTGFLDGGIATVSSTTNNLASFQNLAADTEIPIGVVENGKGNVAGGGPIVPMTYHGDVRAQVTAGGGGNAANPGDYVRNDTGTSRQGYADTAAAGVGTFAHYIDATATATGLRRVIFRPVERN